MATQAILATQANLATQVKICKHFAKTNIMQSVRFAEGLGGFKVKRRMVYWFSV